MPTHKMQGIGTFSFFVFCNDVKEVLCRRLLMSRCEKRRAAVSSAKPQVSLLLSARVLGQSETEITLQAANVARLILHGIHSDAH
jgi:hypothetical protein